MSGNYIDEKDLLPAGYSPSNYVDESNLLARGEKQKAGPLQMPYFMGSSYVNKPTEDDRNAATGTLRGIVADTYSAPSQWLAGIIDAATEGSKNVGIPFPDVRVSQNVSALRNQAAGREGTAPGPYTGLVQGLATAPLGNRSGLYSILQAFGLGSGLSAPNESPLWEGTKTAAVAAPFAAVGRVFGNSPPQSQAVQQIRSTADKEGIPMLYGAHTNSPMMRELERRAERNVLLGPPGFANYAQKTREAIDDKFVEALWRRVGIKGTEFTSENIDDAFKEIGKRLDAPFSGGPITMRSPEVRKVVQDSIVLGKKIAEPDYLDKARAVLTKRLQMQNIDSSELNVMMADLRFYAQKAYDDGNKVAGDQIRKMIEAAREQAIANIPTQAGKDAYRKALTEYANMKTIQELFKRSKESAYGNVDPSKLKGAVEKSMEGGYTRGKADLADLAQLGEAMRPGNVLPEGVKYSPTDAAIYMLFNNPMSRKIRSEGWPVSSNSNAALLRSLGIWTTTPEESQ